MEARVRLPQETVNKGYGYELSKPESLPNPKVELELYIGRKL